LHPSFFLIFHFQILYFFLKQAQKLVNKAFQKNIQFYDIALGAGLIEKLCYNLHCFFIRKWLNILISYAFFEFGQALFNNILYQILKTRALCPIK
jgi:hypothetical protein